MKLLYEMIYLCKHTPCFETSPQAWCSANLPMDLYSRCVNGIGWTVYQMTIQPRQGGERGGKETVRGFPPVALLLLFSSHLLLPLVWMRASLLCCLWYRLIACSMQGMTCCQAAASSLRCVQPWDMWAAGELLCPTPKPLAGPSATSKGMLCLQVTS